jgi:hypothetical protein
MLLPEGASQPDVVTAAPEYLQQDGQYLQQLITCQLGAEPGDKGV